ncbi:MAG: DUF3592 domain-containing protein [Actinobacteria bacterium ATB1]|nr:DUF3592 domain-containing protein [Actinobacteria bacterium ATB1]
MRSRLRHWAPVLTVGAMSVVAVVFACLLFLPDVLKVRTWTEVEGVVLDVTASSSGSFLRWEYRAEGELQSGNAALPGTTPEALGEQGILDGGPIPIRFDPSDPSESVPEVVLERSYALFLVISVVATLAFAVSVLVVIVRGRRDRAHTLADSRPGERRPLTITRSGLLAVKDSGGLTAVLDRGGLSIVGSMRIRWDEILDVAFDPSGNTLRLELASEDFRHVRMSLPPGRREDWAGAVVGLTWFARTYPAVRPALDLPSVCRHLLREVAATAESSHDPESVDWDTDPSSRKRLERSIATLVEEAGVVAVAGRAVRGYELDPTDPAVLASAREWLAHDLAGDLPGDEVVSSALRKAQGRLPPWPFDVLLEVDVPARVP